jgi:hypothetical protein
LQQNFWFFFFLPLFLVVVVVVIVLVFPPPSINKTHVECGDVSIAAHNWLHTSLKSNADGTFPRYFVVERNK